MTVTEATSSEDVVVLLVLPLVVNRGSTAVVELDTGIADAEGVELRSGTTTVVYVEWVAVTVTEETMSSDVVVLGLALGLALLLVNRGSTAVVSDVEGIELVPFAGRVDVAGPVEFVVDE